MEQEVRRIEKVIKDLEYNIGEVARKKLERQLGDIHRTIGQKDYSTILDAIWGALDRLNRATNIQTGVISILLALILWRVW